MKEAACNTSQFDRKKCFNLTCLSLTNYLFSRIWSSLPKLKIDFFRSPFGHCVICIPTVCIPRVCIQYCFIFDNLFLLRNPESLISDKKSRKSFFTNRCHYCRHNEIRTFVINVICNADANQFSECYITVYEASKI